MAEGHAFYALVEMLGGDPAGDPAQFEEVLVAAIENGLIEDALIAKSGKEREALWVVREDMVPGLAAFKPFMVYDVSMALGAMPSFVSDVRQRIESAYPCARTLFYGHAGDGNLHIIVNVGEDGAAQEEAVDLLVYESVRDVGGSIAAEHGIGQSRARFLGYTRSDAEIALMHRIRQALDPAGILNPGKVIR
jgi:FAD/FMN-containing dehydrogenase